MAATAAAAAVRPSPPREGSAACCSLAPATRARPTRLPSSVIPVQRWRCTVTHPRSRRLHGPRCSQSEVASSTVDDDEACELVRGTDVVIGQGDDESVRAYLLEAVKNNNGTCVLFLSDVFGFEDSATRDFAYRIACHGYNVLVPDLFRGNPWKKSLPMEGLQEWLAEQAPERVAGDIDTCRKWLVDDFLAAEPSKKLGVVGFCYGGGRLVETLARDAGACFRAGVCFYGSRMDASLGAQITAPVLFVCGDGDPLCPVETVRELERSARGAKAAVYAGRGHGFAHRPESLEDDGDAEDAFAMMKSWFHDHLLA
ncbi:carboxymethylenebutenolidase homolog isoform X1 [Triticum dicoccoides]|uniref:carboxymethylenebutenolidase homolog isoform X1 n=1 Tax=Triticum dicoccoides TaxID=85692 RepID=UPI0008455ABB|nr:carboxymethylenebutenolidase homolog isoform X1 [Triticum dicoccoides]XP_044409578.1 carboxymethylenebutenolidase homolog isoform X1 [Triticum aestivum]